MQIVNRILNRTPQLPERGKIKIGKKGDERQGKNGPYRLPQKDDHFTVTTLEKDAQDNYLPDLGLMQTIAANTGQAAGHLTRIPVRLLYNDPTLNFASRYAAFDGKTVWCSGNGETAMRLGQGGAYAPRTCPCPNLERDFQGRPGNPKCKIAGMLGVLIDGAPGVGGVWKFRTTSFNSVDGLTASLMFLASVTGGQLANVPLDLVLAPKRVADPAGKPQTVYVVGLEFRGTVEQLRDTGYRIALGNEQAKLRIVDIERDARRMLEAPQDPGAVFDGEDSEDVAEEFHPPQDGDGSMEPEQSGMEPGTDAAAGSGASATDGAPPLKKRRGRKPAEKRVDDESYFSVDPDMERLKMHTDSQHTDAAEQNNQVDEPVTSALQQPAGGDIF